MTLSKLNNFSFWPTLDSLHYSYSCFATVIAAVLQLLGHRHNHFITAALLHPLREGFKKKPRSLVFDQTGGGWVLTRPPENQTAILKSYDFLTALKTVLKIKIRNQTFGRGWGGQKSLVENQTSWFFFFEPFP